MRLHADPQHPDWAPASLHAIVTLDGVRQTNVIHADTEEGWLTRYTSPPITEKLHGTVGLTIPPLNGWTPPLPTPENLARAERGDFGMTCLTMAQIDGHAPNHTCDCPDCRTYWEAHDE